VQRCVRVRVVRVGVCLACVRLRYLFCVDNMEVARGWRVFLELGEVKGSWRHRTWARASAQRGCSLAGSSLSLITLPPRGPKYAVGIVARTRGALVHTRIVGGGWLAGPQRLPRHQRAGAKQQKSCVTRLRHAVIASSGHQFSRCRLVRVARTMRPPAWRVGRGRRSCRLGLKQSHREDD
jgi:hypothetical protein